MTPIKKKHSKNFKRVFDLTPGFLAILLVAFFILISHNPNSKRVEISNETTNPLGKITVDNQKLQKLISEKFQANETAGSETPAPGTENEEINTRERGEEVAAEAGESENTEENADANASQNNVDVAEEETPEIPKPPRAGLIIGVVADAHAGQENGWQKLSTFAWKMANYEYPDIIVDLGDLIESRKDYKNISKKAAEADYRKARSIISRYPVYSVIGNHELLSMSKDNIRSLTGRGSYYSVSVKGYNIIILDSNYNTGGRDNLIYPGTISGGEEKWLENKIESSDRNIIFVHHPLYNLTNSDEIEDIIKDNKKRIILIANGHKHPSSLRTSTFGGVKNYEIPSLRFNKQYAIIKINGTSATVTAKRN